MANEAPKAVEATAPDRRLLSLDALRGAGAYQPLLSVMAVVLVKWRFLYLLYKKRIFLRV